MKNKKLKYILIPLVIIVWGLVFYKVFSYTNEDEFVPDMEPHFTIKEGSGVPLDTFSLLLEYKDPFLKKNRAIKTKNETKNETENESVAEPYNGEQQNVSVRSRQRKPQVQKSQFKPTDIAYGGEIINDNTKNATAVIKIKGRNKLLSKGDVIGDVEIIEVYSDSICLIDQGVARTIKKELMLMQTNKTNIAGLLVVLFLVTGLQAQKLDFEFENKEVVINYEDSTVKAHIMISNEKVKTNSTKSYTWLSANKIKSNYGGYSGRLLDGPYQVLDLNNNLITEGEFKKGLKDGLWKKWDKKGKPRTFVEYKKGLKDGRSEIFDYENNEHSILSYKDGQLSGKCMYYHVKTGEIETIHYKNGLKQGIHSLMRKDGKVIFVKRYKKNILHGKSEILIADSNLVRQSVYKKGLLNGQFAELDTNGTKLRVYRYKNNLKEGLCIDYFSNKLIKTEYKANLKEGAYIEEDLKGKLEIKAYYSKDLLDGEYIEYTPTDTIVKVYLKGNLVK